MEGTEVTYESSEILKKLKMLLFTHTFSSTQKMNAIVNEPVAFLMFKNKSQYCEYFGGKNK